MQRVHERLNPGFTRFVLVLIALMVGCVVAFGQTADTLSGKYEGTVKGTAEAETAVLELKNDAGKITGQLKRGQVSTEVSEGSLVDGKLTLKLGAAAKEGTVNAKVAGDEITGEWIVGTQKSSVQFKKVAATAAAPTATPAAPAAPVAAPVKLDGQWEAVADAEGQPFPFVLVLKIEGENVSGSSSSQLGESPIKTGTWKDGKLNLQIESPNGVIVLSASVIDGKLSGEFDYSGQLQGKWVAVKKN